MIEIKEGNTDRERSTQGIAEKSINTYISVGNVQGRRSEHNIRMDYFKVIV
jgi:hypothetical protein